jgi:hypothetical protein
VSGNLGGTFAVVPSTGQAIGPGLGMRSSILWYAR